MRDKGIGMGIGKIKNGMLILSSKDIKRVQNSRNSNGSKNYGKVLKRKRSKRKQII